MRRANETKREIESLEREGEKRGEGPNSLNGD
jgi:hypothetical protein